MEVGPDKGAIDVLRHDGFSRQRQHGILELAAGLARTICRSWVPGQVTNVDDRPPVVTPGMQQLGDPQFGIGIVAPSPTGVVDGFLDVDNDQCGIVRERRRHGNFRGKSMGQGNLAYRQSQFQLFGVFCQNLIQRRHALGLGVEWRGKKEQCDQYAGDDMPRHQYCPPGEALQ